MSKCDSCPVIRDPWASVTGDSFLDGLQAVLDKSVILSAARLRRAGEESPCEMLRLRSA